MHARKRGADALTGLSNAKKRTCIDGGESAVSSILDDFNCRIEDVKSYLREEVASVLHKSVVHLILSNGTGLLSVSAGIPIECQRDCTKFVTTAALINPLYDKIEDPDNLKIDVHHEGVVLTGVLEEYDLDLNIAVVKVLFKLDVCCVSLDCNMEFPCHGKAVAIWGDIPGTLLAASMALPESFPKHVKRGHCDMVVIFDLDGNFVGMNLGPCLLSRCRICQLLQALRDKQRVKDEKHYTHPDACRYVLNKFQVRDGYSLGYPMPPTGNMILVNTFEEPFGDAYPKGVWTTVRETVRSTLDQIIVSLASFKGNTRFFACTGFFIDFDENVTTVMTSASLVRHPERPMDIVEGLEIKVLLPSKQHVEGTLKHYSLRYNVALISVENFHPLHTMNLDYKTANISSPFVTTRLDHKTRDATLVAVGRCFESGVVMAASGNPVYGSGSLDCRLLFYSSCKITKAGIGGPLVDLDGNFIGMNFYDCHIGTPFMLHVDLCGVLKYLKTKETTYDRGFDVGNIDLDGNGKSVRWPLLKSHWCHPDCLKEDDMPHYERGRIRVGHHKYAYKLGRLTLLK